MPTADVSCCRIRSKLKVISDLFTWRMKCGDYEAGASEVKSKAKRESGVAGRRKEEP
jgi:hypothetical protein